MHPLRVPLFIYRALLDHSNINDFMNTLIPFFSAVQYKMNYTLLAIRILLLPLEPKELAWENNLELRDVTIIEGVWKYLVYVTIVICPSLVGIGEMYFVLVKTKSVYVERCSFWKYSH